MNDRTKQRRFARLLTWVIPATAALFFIGSDVLVLQIAGVVVLVSLLIALVAELWRRSG